MTRVLFWNLGRRQITELVAAAASEYDGDILVLAECAIDVVPLLRALNDGRSRSFGLVNDASNRLLVVSRLPRAWVSVVKQGSQDLICSVRSLLGPPFLLVCVHLAGKMFQSDGDQADLAQRLAATIRDEERREGHARTVVVGDLNMEVGAVSLLRDDGAPDGAVGSDHLPLVFSLYMDRRSEKEGNAI